MLKILHVGIKTCLRHIWQDIKYYFKPRFEHRQSVKFKRRPERIVAMLFDGTNGEDIKKELNITWLPTSLPYMWIFKRGRFISCLPDKNDEFAKYYERDLDVYPSDMEMEFNNAKQDAIIGEAIQILKT